MSVVFFDHLFYINPYLKSFSSSSRVSILFKRASFEISTNLKSFENKRCSNSTDVICFSNFRDLICFNAKLKKVQKQLRANYHIAFILKSNGSSIFQLKVTLAALWSLSLFFHCAFKYFSIFSLWSTEDVEIDLVTLSSYDRMCYYSIIPQYYQRLRNSFFYYIQHIRFSLIDLPLESINFLTSLTFRDQVS